MKESPLILVNASNSEVLAFSVKNEALEASVRAHTSFSPISMHQNWNLT